MLKAVIFDFDGVICDSEPLHCGAFIQVLKSRFGIDLTKDQYYAKYLGYTDVECVEAVAQDFGLTIDDDEFKQLLDEKTAVFEGLARSDSSIIDGVSDFIEMLENAQVPMAICSGALRSDIDLMLKDASFADSFEVIVTADDFSKGKPDPEGFVMTVERLNEILENAILPGECVVIEDSIWGLQAAKAAGTKTIAVTNTYGGEKLAEYSSKVVVNLRELTALELNQLCEA
jgi:beta-phosphoglucomutase